ncbi:MAG: methyltransferase domain-containing protein [Halioglobus sp.]
MSRLNPQDWKSFWNNATVTSMSGGHAEGYDAEILEFWESNISGSYSHIIDLACGNGALSWLVDNTCNRELQTTQITGVDFSDITPFRTLNRKPTDHPQIKFIGNTGIENLPFADQSIDMAISQWGIEYANTLDTVSELGRVLKHDAKICFLCHHEDSDILSNSGMKIEKYRVMLNEKIHDRFLDLDSLYNSHANPKNAEDDPSYSRVTGQLNRALINVKIALQRSEDPSRSIITDHIQEVGALFELPRNFHLKRRRKLILNGLEDIHRTIGRYDDLAAAALSSTEHKELIGMIEQQGFTVTRNSPLIHKGIGRRRPLGDVGIGIVASRGNID